MEGDDVSVESVLEGLVYIVDARVKCLLININITLCSKHRLSATAKGQVAGDGAFLILE